MKVSLSSAKINALRLKMKQVMGDESKNPPVKQVDLLRLELTLSDVAVLRRDLAALQG